MKKILIAVDLQNDFIDGALGTKEAEAIVPAAAARIRECRKEGAEIIATLDTHGEDYMQTREGKKLPVPHCIRGTEGWQLNPVIRIGQETDVMIELLGLCTDICVVSNALLLKAAFPEAEIRVSSACCAGVTPEKHRAALETMASCQIDIL